MKILVACEFSGRVRDAFRRAGHQACSCDYLPSEVPGPHYMGNVCDILNKGWDLLIAHPPCTYLCSSGLHRNARDLERRIKTEEALGFVQLLMNAPIERIAIENPVGCISTRIRPSDQIIQPWEFGSSEQKTTCLWLKNLPPLVFTAFKPKEQRTTALNNLPPSADRGKKRSVTFSGIAEQMALQWGNL